MEGRSGVARVISLGGGQKTEGIEKKMRGPEVRKILEGHLEMRNEKVLVLDYLVRK